MRAALATLSGHHLTTFVLPRAADVIAALASTAHDAVIGLSVADYPGNAADLATGQQALRTAGSDWAAALRDLRALKRSLHLH